MKIMTFDDMLDSSIMIHIKNDRINIKNASARDRTTNLKIFNLTLSQLSYKGSYISCFSHFFDKPVKKITEDKAKI